MKSPVNGVCTNFNKVNARRGSGCVYALPVLLAAFSLVLSCWPGLQLSPAFGETQIGDLYFTAHKDFNFKSVDIRGNQDRAILDIGDTASRESFGQSFSCDLKGDVARDIYTEFFYDDREEERIKRLLITARRGPVSSTIGDIKMDFGGKNFLTRSRDIRGISLDADARSARVKFFTSRVKGRGGRDLIQGNFTRGPFILSGGAIVPESDIVERDGSILTRNIDYVLDYASGTISFVKPLPRGTTVSVGYDRQEDGSEGNRVLEGLVTTVPMKKGNSLEISILRKRDEAQDDSASPYSVADSISSGSDSDMVGILSQTEDAMEHTLLDLQQTLSLGSVTIKAELAKSIYDFDTRVEDQIMEGSAYRLEALYGTSIGSFRLYKSDVGRDFQFMDKAPGASAPNVEGIELKPVAFNRSESSLRLERGVETGTALPNFLSATATMKYGDHDLGMAMSAKRTFRNRDRQADDEAYGDGFTSDSAGDSALQSGNGKLSSNIVDSRIQDSMDVNGHWSLSPSTRLSMNLNGYRNATEMEDTALSVAKPDDLGGRAEMTINLSPWKSTRIVTELAATSDREESALRKSSEGAVRFRHKLSGGMTLKGTGKVTFQEGEERSDDAVQSESDRKISGSISLSSKPWRNVTSSVALLADENRRIVNGEKARPLSAGTSFSLRYNPVRSVTILSKMDYRGLQDSERKLSGKERGIDLSCTYRASGILDLKGGIAFENRDGMDAQSKQEARIGASCRISDRLRFKSNIFVARNRLPDDSVLTGSELNSTLTTIAAEGGDNGSLGSLSDNLNLSTSATDDDQDGEEPGEARVRGDMSLDYRVGDNMNISLEIFYRSYDGKEGEQDYDVRSGSLRMSMKI
ncbi:MAG: hypothetical protein CVV64_08765 [Candidatus Wallbacteria bacterium HGW-Wallbacteria-1]|jgi:hypothetical protein|uniref:Uncharacterized protein n=1 Tax=Candidatus Wallbacteria bacterium HGW-Wallbacteria-1 TaxID=2013854 RepID=A0A2N1PQ37_9BACT|nr:MAG: hypothetical protein CVV64_08765 [Candidatus Wallbacteria bacterium HGW-Wallbacteria-1]